MKNRAGMIGSPADHQLSGSTKVSDSAKGARIATVHHCVASCKRAHQLSQEDRGPSQEDDKVSSRGCEVQWKELLQEETRKSIAGRGIHTEHRRDQVVEEVAVPARV